MYVFILACIAFAGATEAVAVLVRQDPPSPPAAIAQKATPGDLKWQPGLDFDTDGCYNVPVIDEAGNIAVGLPSRQYWDPSDLDNNNNNNNNVYSRARYNHGWCGHLYAYYFEKDVAVEHVADAGGHTHDWEHICVWANKDVIKYVGVSQHGGYDVKAVADARMDDTHAKVVYNKDGGSTHDFRFANEGDDAIENAKGVWFRGALISWNGFPGNTRDILAPQNSGNATFKLVDNAAEDINTHPFPDALNGRLPQEVKDAGFDVNVDVASSPGNP